jgi:glucosamine-phosphate N-acetyltransferase
MIIRDFKKEDIDNGLLETYKEVWSISEISDFTLNSFLSNNNHMLVVEHENDIIGTGILHIENKLIRNGGIAGLIEDVAIREKYRGNDIGSKLLDALIKKAKDLGCYKVILSCFPDRVNFYERNGFINECITMRNNLEH